MKKAYLILISIISCNLVFAQDSIPLPTQALEVVKQFQPKIGDAKAIDISPKKRIQQNYPALQLNFNTPPQIFTISYPDPVIKPLVFEEEDKTENLRDGYVKLGYGNNQSPLIEAQVHYDIQDWFQTGISVRHLSARDTTSDVFRSTSKTLAEFYASYYLTDQTKVTADVHYQNDNRSLCCSGIKEFDLLPTTQLDEYGLAIRIDHNSFSVKGFSTKNNLSVNRINSKSNEQTESRIAFSSTSNKTINKKLLFNLPLGFEYFTSDLWTDNPYQIQGRPNVLFKTEKYSVRVGAFLAANDSHFVRPDISVSYMLPWHHLEAKASYKANSSVNSLHKFYTEMPYFNHITEMQSSFAEEELARLGVSYKNKRANVYAGFLYGNYVNQALYTFEGPSHHFYELTNYNGFGAEINGSYKFKKILQVEAGLIYRKFNVDEFDNSEAFINPFYIPQVQANIKLEQRLFSSLRIYETLEFMSSQSIKYMDDDVSLISSIDPIVDLGVGLEYLYKNRIGIFAEANNLLNKSYQRYYLDKSFKLNYHLGIKFLF